ncbi:hypothetical protein PITCH_A180007 [uncultured Desulfobacterium sp.]|uniref:Uncharacterized protein n=1 Tax=uncultured Desulfobacterium sp. TaxID=201089 RepID=A0A445MV05_9BACT|nr:hypothetical protein PITCH_A180007 [uncultured Desulfobacterium sp.]
MASPEDIWEGMLVIEEDGETEE